MKLVQSYRVRTDRAEKLKDKSFELSMEAKMHFKEPDLISYLIDECMSAISIKDGKMTINKNKIKSE